MAVFSFVQISDLHFCIEPDWLTPHDAGSITGQLAAAYDTLLGRRSQRGQVLPLAYPSSYSADVALGLLRHLTPKMTSLDALLVTGDLATTGRDDDLRVACDFFERRLPEDWNPWQYLEGADQDTLLSNENQCVLALPGNHDRYDGLLVQPSNRSFERFFGTSWDFNRGHANQPAGVSNRIRRASIVKDDAAVIFCLGDCTLNSLEEVAGWKGRWGQGIVTDQLISDFETATRDAKTKLGDLDLHPCVVWAVHFPPNYPDISDLLALTRGHSLILAAERCGVDLILAGHTHDPLAYRVKGQHRSVPIYCCGSTTGLSNGKPFAFTQFELDVSSTGVRVHPTLFAWSDAPSQLAFVPQPSFPQFPPRTGRGVQLPPFVG